MTSEGAMWIKPDWWTAVATIALVVVALGQLVLFYVQLRYMRTSLHDAKVAADAARESANVAKQSADAAQVIDRAYVFATVQFSGVSIVPSDTAINRVVVTLRNYGKTPAVLTMFRGDHFLADGYTYPDELGPTIRERPIPDGMVIPPGGGHEIPLSFTISLKEWGDVERADKTFGFRGRADYKDVFGVDHSTGFCWHFAVHASQRALMMSPTKLNYRT